MMPSVRRYKYLGTQKTNEIQKYPGYLPDPSKAPIKRRGPHRPCQLILILRSGSVEKEKKSACLSFEYGVGPWFGLQKAIAVPHVPYFPGYPGNTLGVPRGPRGNQEDPGTLTPGSVTGDNDYKLKRLKASRSRSTVSRSKFNKPFCHFGEFT